MYKRLIVIGITLYASLVYSYSLEKDNFRLFESTAYLNQDEMYKVGFVPIEEIGTQFLWGVSKDWNNDKSASKLPPKSQVCKVIRSIDRKHKWVILDIEHWSLSTKWVSEDVVNENVQKYVKVIQWARECGPNFKFGYYGQVPISDHQSVLNKSKINDWVHQHSRLKPIIDVVDALFPSLYTSYENYNIWETLATEYIKIARELAGGKPVYVYLWPQYHPGVKDKKYEFIDKTYWRRQLELSYKLADGIVLWGGWKDGRMKWDDNAAWWVETKIFIEDKF